MIEKTIKTVKFLVQTTITTTCDICSGIGEYKEYDPDYGWTRKFGCSACHGTGRLKTSSIQSLAEYRKKNRQRAKK